VRLRHRLARGFLALGVPSGIGGRVPIVGPAWRLAGVAAADSLLAQSTVARAVVPGHARRRLRVLP
jgi:hypothetical protein